MTCVPGMGESGQHCDRSVLLAAPSGGMLLQVLSLFILSLLYCVPVLFVLPYFVLNSFYFTLFY